MTLAFDLRKKTQSSRSEPYPYLMFDGRGGDCCLDQMLEERFQPFSSTARRPREMEKLVLPRGSRFHVLQSNVIFKCLALSYWMILLLHSSIYAFKMQIQPRTAFSPHQGIGRLKDTVFFLFPFANIFEM